MKLERDDCDDPNPNDGWVTGPVLIDTEVTSIVLCRYTAQKRMKDTRCAPRELGLHKDVECAAVYLQADALSSGTVDQSLFPEVQDEVRIPAAGDDVTGQLP